MGPSDSQYPVEAPGWAAIDAALGVVHPGQTPHQYMSKTAYDLESPSPLPAIGVYEGAEPDHWHFTTYGLTELFEKSSPRAEVSGFGFELTFRLPRQGTGGAPPTWPIRMLQGVGQYVLAGHETLDTGHVIDLGGPIVPPSADAPQTTLLRGVMTVPDPSLGKIETPHGSVLFLQLFGLTAAEVETMGDWELERKVGLVCEVEPKGITRPGRVGFADDERAAPVFRRYALKVLI